MQDTLEDLDQPAVDPAAIRSQKETMESLQEDLDNIQEDIQLVHDEGQELVKLVGDPEIPEVEKNIDELEANFTTLNSKWVERQKSLDDALQHATTFQNELMVSRGQEIIGYVLWSLLELLSWCPIFKSIHCNSFVFVNISMGQCKKDNSIANTLDTLELHISCTDPSVSAAIVNFLAIFSRQLF